MNKLTIFYGAAKPAVAYGKNQSNLLEFAHKYPGWHTFGKDRAARKAIAGLVRRGLIEVQGDQFKFSPKSS